MCITQSVELSVTLHICVLRTKNKLEGNTKINILTDFDENLRTWVQNHIKLTEKPEIKYVDSLSNYR